MSRPEPLTLEEEDFLRTYGAAQLDARQVRRMVPRLIATLDAARAAHEERGLDVERLNRLLVECYGPEVVKAGDAPWIADMLARLATPEAAPKEGRTRAVYVQDEIGGRAYKSSAPGRDIDMWKEGQS